MPSGLRAVTDAGNQMNRTRLNRNNTSGAAGVYWHTGARKWAVVGKSNYVTKYLGLFADKAEAIATKVAHMKGKR